MNDMFNWPEFFCQCSGTTEDLSSDSPKYSLPFALLTAICQNFIPPLFSHVQYAEGISSKPCF